MLGRSKRRALQLTDNEANQANLQHRCSGLATWQVAPEVIVLGTGQHDSRLQVALAYGLSACMFLRSSACGNHCLAGPARILYNPRKFGTSKYWSPMNGTMVRPRAGTGATNAQGITRDPLGVIPSWVIDAPVISWAPVKQDTVACSSALHCCCSSAVLNHPSCNGCTSTAVPAYQGQHDKKA